jgi:hypothetical protein
MQCVVTRQRGRNNAALMPMELYSIHFITGLARTGRSRKGERERGGKV